ncbi:PRC and DUF2382 domain-containing protein [Nocardia sp. NPDC050406]|uniref:PRC and DUF2382 domain-containing protein n=1 Tax=Nocardia sp. NPDC050406 TaxID=3364318 RepID=UPI0037B5631D
MSKTTLESLIGCTAYDKSGSAIGQVEQFYVDNATGQPTWAVVSTGSAGDHSLVPLTGAQYQPADRTLQIPVDSERVRSAPHMEHYGRIDPDDEQALLDYYRLDRRPTGGRTGLAQQIQPGPDEPMTAGYTDDTMLRSEERLVVGTDREEVGTARMHKYVETEQQDITVPITHEEARLVREPITDRTEAAGDIGEQDREVILHADHVRVDKETVPVERVRLVVDEVEEQQTVSGTVRKERIETEGIDPEERA